MIYLDMNENHCAEPISVPSKDYSESYPREMERELLNRISDRISKTSKINESDLFLVHGIDDGIDIFLQFLKMSNKNILIDVPNYCGVLEAVKSYSVDAIFYDQGINYSSGKLFDMINSHKVHAVYLCDPRNPIGNCIDDVSDIIFQLQKRGILVFVDGAYAEYNKANDSYLGLLNTFDNIIYAKTFSKAYGLAGIRCGYLVTKNKGFKDYTTCIERAQPYRFSNYTLSIAGQALMNKRRLQQSIACMKENKNNLVSFLIERKIEYIESKTNFVLIKSNEKLQGMDTYLQEQGLLINNCNSFNLDGFYRVSIGSHCEIEKLKELMAAYMEGNYDI